MIAGGLEHDAEGLIADLLAGVPKQPHAALGLEHPILDRELAWPEHPPAGQVLAVEQRHGLGGGEQAYRKGGNDSPDAYFEESISRG